MRTLHALNATEVPDIVAKVEGTARSVSGHSVSQSVVVDEPIRG